MTAIFRSGDTFACIQYPGGMGITVKNDITFTIYQLL